MTFPCQNQVRNKDESATFRGYDYFLGIWIKNNLHFRFSRAHARQVRQCTVTVTGKEKDIVSS